MWNPSVGSRRLLTAVSLWPWHVLWENETPLLRVSFRDDNLGHGHILQSVLHVFAFDVMQAACDGPSRSGMFCLHMALFLIEKQQGIKMLRRARTVDGWLLVCSQMFFLTVSCFISCSYSAIVLSNIWVNSVMSFHLFHTFTHSSGEKWGTLDWHQE